MTGAFEQTTTNSGVSTQTALPDPDAHPLAAIVIYDGQCRFCEAQVGRLARWDTQGELAFLPLQDARVAERFPQLSYDALMQAMHLVLPDGRIFAGAAAFRRISRLLPRLWVIVPLLHIPFSLPLWETLYRVVARFRYRLGGKQSCEGSCDVHFGKQ